MVDVNVNGFHGTGTDLQQLKVFDLGSQEKYAVHATTVVSGIASTRGSFNTKSPSLMWGFFYLYILSFFIPMIDCCEI